MPIKVEHLRNELRDQLNKDDIQFNPSITKFNNILKGMGFRYARIKNRNVIFEREDLTRMRADYLRQGIIELGSVQKV